MNAGTLSPIEARRPQGIPAGGAGRSPRRGPFARRRGRWGAMHERLAAHPLFAACSRDEIRRVARWGDEAEVGAGEVILREDTIVQWFVVVLEGSLALSRRAEPLGTIDAGGFVGHVAMLGFAPQDTTVVTTAPCRLFVIGRRHLISLAYDVRGLQVGMYPHLDEAGFLAELRRLRTEADVAWSLMSKAALLRAADPDVRPAWLSGTPSRRGSGVSAFASLAAQALRRPGQPSGIRAPTPFSARRVIIGMALLAVSVVAVVALAWHPPYMVIVPGHPIDVSQELSVSGVPIHAINGKYVVTPVEIERPSLAGVLLAAAGGERVVAIASRSDQPRQTGREAFAEARRRATAAAAAAAGVDPASIDVDVRDHGLQGPSAALVYALALTDLLNAEDMAQGRTVAATGALDDDAHILKVGFVAEKAKAALAGGATVFLVPRGQLVDTGSLRVWEVSSVAEALALLLRG